MRNSNSQGPVRPTYPQVPYVAQMQSVNDLINKSSSRNTTISTDKEFNSHSTNTMKIVDFLYPQNQGKRYPLTRCLLSCLIENTYVNLPVEKQNFRTIIDVLKELLDDMNGRPNDTSIIRLAILSDFMESIDTMDEWVIMSYEMFFNYSKTESQKYTVACLLYDLIPLINVSFDKIVNAINNRYTLQAVIAYQAKGAVYDNDMPMRYIFQGRAMADKLFSQNDTTKKAILQIPLFLAADDINESCELNYDLIHVKNIMMDMISMGAMRYAEKDIFNTDTVFSTVMQAYAAIAQSSDSLRDMVIMTLERILMIEGNVQTLLPQKEPESKSFASKPSRKSKDIDEFIF